MELNVYQPKRTRNGRHVTNRLWGGKYRIEGQPLKNVALETTDEAEALKKLRKLAEEDKASVDKPKTEREAAQMPLLKHLQAFLASRRTLGRDSRLHGPTRKAVGAPVHRMRLERVRRDHLRFIRKLAE